LKHIVVSDVIHKRLKTLAAKEDKKLTEVVTELLIKALKKGR